MLIDEVSAVVVDMGSTFTKAGFAGEDTPKSVFPSVCLNAGDGLWLCRHAAVAEQVAGLVNDAGASDAMDVVRWTFKCEQWLPAAVRTLLIYCATGGWQRVGKEVVLCGLLQARALQSGNGNAEGDEA